MLRSMRFAWRFRGSGHSAPSSTKISHGARCLPTHLRGAGSPARVLITTSTVPVGCQEPGTVKDRMSSRVDVSPPGASLTPESRRLSPRSSSWKVSHESLGTSRYVPMMILKARSFQNNGLSEIFGWDFPQFARYFWEPAGAVTCVDLEW